MSPTARGSALGSAFIILAVLVAGVYAGYAIASVRLSARAQDGSYLTERISILENEIEGLKSQLSEMQIRNSSAVIYSLNDLYESIKGSIVTVKGIVPSSSLFGEDGEVLGSGFVTSLTGEPLVVTNYHVIDRMVNGSVTFIDGEGYPFEVLGTDRYSDLAVLRVQAPASKLVPIPVITSRTLAVGDQVIAIGNPYGLQGTLTAGIVSALGRAINSEGAGSYLIADVIQISTPINPGNSGGPLIDSAGRVVGVTTAIISGSQGVGFAVPSDTLIREIPDLVLRGTYDKHAYIGIVGTSVDYTIAQAAGLSYTYGVLIQSVARNGPAEQAGLRGGSRTVEVAGSSLTVGGDLIVQMDGTPIRMLDDLSSFLVANASPGETVNVTVIRDGQPLMIPVTLAARP